MEKEYRKPSGPGFPAKKSDGRFRPRSEGTVKRRVQKSQPERPKTGPSQMVIRHAHMKDLDALAQLESLCFPAQEAADRETLAERIHAYGNHFLIMFIGGKLVSFLNGPVTEEKDLTDAMYTDPSFHTEDGKWQMIFGVDTLPEYRRRGLASKLLMLVEVEARNQERLGIVLTCKKEKISFYKKQGFVEEGLSESVHGGAQWYQMRKTFA